MWFRGCAPRNCKRPRLASYDIWLEACTPATAHTVVAVESPGGSMSQQTHAPLPQRAQSALASEAETGAPLVNGVIAMQPTDPVNPTEEDAYWRDNYINRPYADQTLSYDYYRPA